MPSRLPFLFASSLLIVFVPAQAPAQSATSDGSDELAALFAEWREFEQPAMTGHLPDYSASAMEAQHRELSDWQARLRDMDVTNWPVAQQIDWHLLRAEMNGLDFDHRIRRPWARDPAFYVSIYPAESDVPAHEGPVVHGWIDLWTYTYPLSAADAAELADRIGAIPALLQQAAAQ